MNTLELCAGIGGLSLGLERAGMTVVGQVEINEFCRKVLDRHWPHVPKHDDVHTAINWWNSQSRPQVDLVAAGFPCQPASTAGKGLGEDDERWLWPAVADVIDHIRPDWVVWENVPGLRTRGLRTVLTDLDRLGYVCRVGEISACALGAPHTRTRLFGVAHTKGYRCGQGRGVGQGPAFLELVRRGEEPGRSWPAEPAVSRVAYGVPSGLDRRRALGNAVVPHVAEYIGRLVMAAESAA